MDKKAPNGCIGKCCSQFHLNGDTKLGCIQEGAETGDREVKLIGEMLIPLGHERETGWPVYTCKYWDKESFLCTIYERRPEMCREYPEDGEVCEWEGCEYQKESV